MSSLIGVAHKLEHHPELHFNFKFVWLEGVMDARVGFVDEFPDWNNVDKWQEGRLFGDKVEYRWQRGNGNTLHAVIILDEGSLPPDFEGLPIEQEGDVAHLMLWGKWINPSLDNKSNPNAEALFYSPDLPQIMKYPISMILQPEDSTPRLTIKRYRHKIAGEFVRCTEFKMESERKSEADYDADQPI